MTSRERLRALARLATEATDVPRLVGEALPLLRHLAGALTTAARVAGPVGPVLLYSGRPLDLDALPPADAPDEVPSPWCDLGVERSWVHALPDDRGVLVLAWGATPTGAAPARADPAEGPGEDPVTLETALALLDTAVSRVTVADRYADLVSRVDDAQALANMGDYDWHIATDSNRWSDQLFRIYGYEPGDIDPAYEVFLSHIHPDDRERIKAIHQHSYATGEPYRMIERIVRRDGALRYLSSNGQVVTDETGTPVRMRGTCVDVTDRVLAEQERERTASRFRNLVECSPEAILVAAGDGRILTTNRRAHALLGGDPAGLDLARLLPGVTPAPPVTAAEDGDDRVGADLEEQGAFWALEVVGIDGRRLLLDGTTASLADARDGACAYFLRDAAPRLASESLTAGVREAEVKRRQALEINDNVVQGLVAAGYALRLGDGAAGAEMIDRTLHAARRMMDDLLHSVSAPGEKALGPGDLTRSEPAATGAPLRPVASGPSAERAAAPDGPDGHRPGAGDVAADGTAPGGRRPRRILIADDAEDLRLLLRITVEAVGDSQVVGEAADGEEAVRLCAELEPDVVLLDLAMPRMDGLEALPLIRAAAPQARVIVLSGFDRSTMAGRVLEAGAARYVEKGIALSDISGVIDEVLATAG